MWAACGGPQLAPGGAGVLDDCAQYASGCDEGAGIIARRSVSLVSDDRSAAAAPENAGRSRRLARPAAAEYGGDSYGASGGDPYGGTSYAHWVAPVFNYVNATRAPHYAVTATGLDATIEGTVTWPGRVPVAPTCGARLAIGAGRGLAGAIVYIEHVTTGRAIGGTGRTQLGGVIAKHGCALAPTAQIAVPIPSAVVIHGDGTRARLRVTPPTGAATVVDLQEGGLVVAEVKPGLTRIAGEDGRLGAAWVLGLDTPYVAVTDDNGRFRIEQLAPGTYDLTIWQAPLATAMADGTLTYGAPIVAHRTVKVGVKQTQTISVALAASP